VSTASRTAHNKTADLSEDHAVRAPAYQTLADDLRGQIVSGLLRPGERLPTEPQLCVRFGLSRSTVREALRLLASQHLIVTTRGVTGGSFVAELSAEQLGDSLASAVQVLRSGTTVSGADFMEMRELLETSGAALAAERRTDDDLAKLRGALPDPAEPDIDVKLAAYWDFFTALACAVHNPLFELLSRPLRRLANERELAATAPVDAWHHSAESCRQILACVEERDGAGAAAAIRAHLRDVRAIHGQDEIRLVGA
jgi:GntR family transcriptional regulator, transcriptional repressor for pyruvate dehydrogenase complex